MEKFEVIADTDVNEFTHYVNKYLDNNYKILSSNCGIYQKSQGYSEPFYQAILLKED